MSFSSSSCVPKSFFYSLCVEIVGTLFVQSHEPDTIPFGQGIRAATHCHTILVCLFTERDDQLLMLILCSDCGGSVIFRYSAESGFLANPDNKLTARDLYSTTTYRNGDVKNRKGKQKLTSTGYSGSSYRTTCLMKGQIFRVSFY